MYTNNFKITQMYACLLVTASELILDNYYGHPLWKKTVIVKKLTYIIDFNLNFVLQSSSESKF